MEGTIWFPGNPWPDGHRVEQFDWTGRLDGLGRLWFDLTLRTAHYDEAGVTDDEDEEPEDRPDWQAPIVWNNYHRCTMSSVFWENATGLLAATPERPFRLAGPEPLQLTADPLPIEEHLDADPAFHVYLLGHDSVADHTLTFTADGDGTHHIDWTGRIALTYAGDDTFDYAFRAEIRGVRLTHVDPMDGMPADEARRRVAHLLGMSEEAATSMLANA